MGLDIYLYRYENHDDTTRREEEHERESSAIWDRITGGRKYETLTEAEKEAARTESVAVAKRLGLDEWGNDDKSKEKIELPSAAHPDHMFKIGYFRSSYNDGGINSVLRARIGITLSDLFHDDNRYEFLPDWDESKRRAEAALQSLKTANQSRPFRAVAVGRNIFGGDAVVDSEAAALDVFTQVLSKHPPRADHPFEEKTLGGSFGSREGNFWLHVPLQVRGAIQGERFGQACTYLVYDDESENMRWYEQALEIVIETCDYVLAQPNIGQYWLHWSG